MARISKTNKPVLDLTANDKDFSNDKGKLKIFRI